MSSNSSISPAPPHRNDILVKILKGAVPVAISAGLLAWLFHKVDLKQIEHIMRQGVDYRYLLMMMVLTVMSHVIRGIRWGIQLRGAGIPRIPVLAESVSIFGAYALNLVFPFLGEAWRCLYISRREGAKLSTVVGTDLGDRASDAVMIGALIILSLFVARPALLRFADHYAIGETLMHTLSNHLLWATVAIIVGIAIAVLVIFRQRPWARNIDIGIRRIWDGFSVLFHMKGIGMYILLTFGIWTCYFMETYLVFYAFPFTRALISPSLAYGLLPGLVVFVFGSCSMGIPSNGGLGPWNVAVMFALSLYGISDTDGAAFSLIYWSFQALIIIASGIFSAFYIISSRKKAKTISTN
ncbi:MAG: flippase-like domain-containing protein [Pseudoflavonifractor sp.]|nr:flippase-like domain-containing protein [Alloprevotella sp.]MCM1117141.1 flippase-like domain-containing protein [Pseudoflavonifractor sp.]